MATTIAVVLGAVAGWWVAGERILPLERNPVSRLVHWLYGGRLSFALRHKALSLSLPLLMVFVGLGAWIGMPTMLRPVENFAKSLGADLNGVPGYVDAKHYFLGLKTNDWICLLYTSDAADE